MPPKAAKRKAKDDLWGTPDVRTEKKTRRAATSRVDESDGELRHNGNKQFESWAGWQKTFNDRERTDRSQFASRYKKYIEVNRESIQALFSKSTKDLDDGSQKHAASFKKACNDIEHRSKYGTMKHAPSPPVSDDNALSKAGRNIFQDCRDMVAVHEQANAKTLAQANTQLKKTRATWQEDTTQVEKVLLYGAQYGSKIIEYNTNLSASDEDRRQLLTPPRDALKGPGQMALEMHQKSIEKLLEGSPTWGEDVFIYVENFRGIMTVSGKQADES